jgi:ElaB/YqjD/DUF883 family membrane-anchored ribosome-binding protein
MSHHHKPKNGSHRNQAVEDTANDVTETASGIMDGAREAAGAVGDFARNAARSVTDTAKRATERVGNVAGDAVDVAREYAGEAAGTAREYAGEAFDISKGAVENAHTQVTKWVRRNPITALAVGVGVGFVIGRGIFRS